MTILHLLLTTPRRAGLTAAVLVALVLAGCGTRQPSPGGSGAGPGGYAVGAGNYRQDGPHANPPPNLGSVPDAVPRIEPFASGPNRPYVIAGKRYVPETVDKPYRGRGRASWYGRQFHGRPTSNGETYDMYAMTAAHPTMPIPSYARVTRADNGKSVIVRINDRGPFVDSRVIDLSYVAAYRLGTLANGTGEVLVERITHDEIRRGSWPAPAMIAQAPAATAPAPISPASTSTASWSGAGSVGATAAARTMTPSSTPASAASGTTPNRAPPPARDTGIAVGGPGGGQAFDNRFAADRVAAAAAAPDPIAALTIPVPAAPPPRNTQPAPPVPENFAVAEPAPPTMIVAASGPAFLQLGAFGEARNAEQFAERIRANLAALGNLRVVNNGDDVYRVTLGPFNDRGSAVASVDAVYGQTGIRPHVVAR